jgi:TRAP-type mannitol/chloroaromatic compound transport system permease small subunit
MPEPEAPSRGIPALDALSDGVGRAVAWLTLLMVAVTCLVVVLRYFFGTGRIWLQESITWMHAAVFLLGAAYALRTSDHVRVDVFYRRASSRARAWIDLLGVLLLLAPTCAFLLYASYDYVLASWQIRESSREAGGLRGLYLLKSLIPLAAVLLLLQGLSELARAWRAIRETAK